MPLSTTNFDEINALVGYSRSMPYEQYFGEQYMLTEEQIRERIRLAELLEKEFRAVLMILLEDYPDIDPSIIDEMRERYLMALATGGLLGTDELLGGEYYAYVVDHAATFAANAIASTMENRDVEYTYSEDRAMFMAENESQSIWNAHDFFAEFGAPDGATHKTWVTMHDNRVRDTHAEVDGETVRIDEPFFVGGYEMMFPRDEEYGGAGAEEIVGCRCMLEYSSEKE